VQAKYRVGAARPTSRASPVPVLGCPAFSMLSLTGAYT
jgi:hypothetical protein